MLLKAITLENFQGIRELNYTFPDCCSVSIYGDNATGKTTVFNAITWLLFDRSSTGAKGFSPKTRGRDGELHHLNHSVTGEFVTDDGRVITFEKVFHENWKKKRGAARAEFAGHVTDYFVNGVPVKENDYTATILQNCGGDAEKAKILTMPDYFSEQMKWEDRRKILLEVCGDVTDEDVIRSNNELAELPEFLKIPGTSGESYSIDDYKKIAAARRRDINKQLDMIPARIDEASKQITEPVDLEDVQVGINACKDKINRLQLQKFPTITNDDASATIKKQASEEELKLLEKKREYQKRAGEAEKTYEKELQAKREEAQKIYDQGLKLKHQLDESKLEAERLKAKRKEVLEEFKRVSSAKWNPDSENCPTCGRRLPEDKIEEMREHFNLNRSNNLEMINKKGKETCSKDMITAAEKKIDDLKAEIGKLNRKITSLTEESDKIKADHKAIPDFEETDEYKTRKASIDKLKESLKDSTPATEKAVADTDAEIEEAQKQLEAWQEKLAQDELNKRQKERVKELEAEQKKLAAEFDKTEKGLHLAGLFTVTKIAMLTDKINGKFKSVSFQLFAQQINGGIKETCDVLVPGPSGQMVPYAYANNAARINAGLEIIGTLSKHWNLKMPVVIDNAEAVTHIQKIDTQVIRLVVSEKDKTLRVERED